MKQLFQRVEWNIGLVRGAQPAAFLQERFHPDVQWLKPPKRGTFVADPFIFEYEGRTAILCERFDYRRGKGHIAAFEVIGGDVVDCGAVIEEREHLAYPCVFEYEGEQFCVPDAKELGGVQMYRMARFPDKWEHVGAVLDEPVVDPTVFFHGGLWWILGASPLHPNETLCAWYAANPTGPWTAHKGNPIKIDPASARPAGKPFFVDGNLYRPAQNCSSRYGQALSICRIDRLTPAEFSETVTSHVSSANAPYDNGIHTLNSTARYCIVDGQRDVFAIEKMAGSLARRIHRRRVADGRTRTFGHA